MEKTFDIAKAVEAQKEYCKEYAAKHPQDWASKMMARGEGFAPIDGRCWNCGQNIYSKEGYVSVGKRRLEQKREGHSVEYAREYLVTYCPFCNRSFVD